jgi:hypothetical protein
VIPAEASPVAAVLTELARSVAPERIDRVWIFGLRRAGERETGLIVLSLYVAGDPDRLRREIVTARFDRPPSGGRPAPPAVATEGVAPAGRVDGVISGVLRRLGEAAEAPEELQVGGVPERWTALIDARTRVGAVDPGLR